MAAEVRLARVAARTALRPNRAISGRRVGAMMPMPPSRMAMEERLAKPQRAKVMMPWVTGVRVPAGF